LNKSWYSHYQTLLADYWQKTVDRTVEKWRFAEVDVSSAYNDFGGLYNAPNYPNQYAFTALKADGSIAAWGTLFGSLGTPSDNGYTVRIIWRIKRPTKIIIGTRDIHLSKTPLFYCSIYCSLPVICQ
jgi:hypothetical protein